MLASLMVVEDESVQISLIPENVELKKYALQDESNMKFQECAKLGEPLSRKLDIVEE